MKAVAGNAVTGQYLIYDLNWLYRFCDGFLVQHGFLFASKEQGNLGFFF